MAFEKIDKEGTNKPEGKECILVYGFEGKNYTKLKSFAAMIGVRDIIKVDKNMLDAKLGDIIEGKVMESKEKSELEEPAIVFNAFSDKKLNTFIGNFNVTGLNKPLLATVTPTSIKWSFRDLVKELQREREAISKSDQMTKEDHRKED